MAEVLSFPLTPRPLSLSHADGTMLKTQKGKLMEELESRIFNEKPNHVDVTITDAMFFFICGQIYQQPLVPLQGFC